MTNRVTKSHLRLVAPSPAKPVRRVPPIARETLERLRANTHDIKSRDQWRQRRR